MDRNLDDLMKAAQTKLNVEKKQEEPVDIYADIREDVEEDIPGTTIAYDESIVEEQPIGEDDLQLYDNGPYMSQIDIWNKQYGKGRVMHVQIIDKHFTFRTLNRFEYKKILAMENIDALMREEIICSQCVLHPRDYDFKKMATFEAGYPSALAQIIMESSGFTQEYSIEVL